MGAMCKEKIIIELDEISRLYNELISIKEQESDFLNQKELKEKQLIEEFSQTMNAFKDELLGRFFKEVSSWSRIGVSYQTYPPDHWKHKECIKSRKWEKHFNEDASLEQKEKHYNSFKDYDNIFLLMLNEYKNKQFDEFQIYKQKLQDFEIYCEGIIKDLLSKKQELSNQLYSITVISEDLFGDASRIANMLKQGRAETLKEAINLSIIEKREEEREEARRMEEFMRNMLLEQQIRENQMHNEVMLRAAEEQSRAIKEHNAAMEKELKAQTELMKKTEKAQSDAAEARCWSCANRSRCSYTQKQAHSCSSYVKG